MLNRARHEIVTGAPDPLGATLLADGANFAIYSENAEKIELCLFDAGATSELQRLPLPGRTGNVWHGFVPRLDAGLLYGYRVHGRYCPRDGHRFNANKLLIDPYARALSGRLVHHESQFGFMAGRPDADLSFDTRDSAPFMPKCRLVASGPAADTPTYPRTPWRDTVIYELHVKGFSQLNPDIAVPLRGTYAALGDKAAIRHFKSLGITAVELLPIMAFNDEPHLVEKGMSNYWGYNPYCFMAPDPRYARGDARAELAIAIRNLHEAGIEVLLDVVFNHTGEGWHLGPTLSLKGIDNAAYYRLDATDRSRYVDHAGCGNTLDLSRPHVRRLMLDSLRAWVCEFGIDGFRFDLATTLGRQSDGRFDANAETLRAIADDPVLSRVKLIAEPWDCGPDGYQLGRFPPPWTEWNDRARDTIRRFWRGDEGLLPEFARSVCGSTESFGVERGPLASINFVTAHDGMRLRDLVSYAGKHNAANGENNRDGTGADFAHPYGPEGPATNPEQRRTRAQQMRNLIATLLLAQGVPMLSAGDEIGHSQGGNNNPYCQDNAITWIDWAGADDDDRALFDFVRSMLALRRRHPALRQARTLSPDDASWLTPDRRSMSDQDWQLPWARCFGLMLNAPSDEPAEHLLLLFNAHDGTVDFQLPVPADGGGWTHLIDTTVGGDHRPPASESQSEALILAPRSLTVLSTEAARGTHASNITNASALDRLADMAGIEPSYRDLAGDTHAASPQTQRRLLNAMGFAVGDAATEARSLQQARATGWAELLPPVVVTRLEPQDDRARPFIVPLTVAAMQIDQSVKWRLCLEDGRALSGEARCRDLAILDQLRIDGRQRLRLALSIAPPPIGYHSFRAEFAGETVECVVIAAPSSCYQPDGMPDGQRVWGVAHQLYALRGDNGSGIGDFGALAELVDTVAAFGGACVGVNPLHALSLAKPDDASPYAPSSRCFLNPLYVDLHAISHARGAGPEIGTGTKDEFVDYARVKTEKLASLRQIFARFENAGRSADGSASVTAFENFLVNGGEALNRFAIHQVLEEQFGRDASPAWDRHRDPRSAETVAFSARHAQSVRFHAWMQFEADRQLGVAKGNLHLGLYGDLAVGVDPLGADVWAEPEAFAADVRIGAPPDQFSPTGQEWGLLPFNPQYLRRTAYRPFIAMIRAGMRHCGAIRIDHVMWLERMFWVPHGGIPSDGGYVRFPIDDLMAVLALESHRHRCVVIGEDLGTVPDGFRERMQREGLLSYKLMRFERYQNGLYGRPGTYAATALATAASHDLPTIAGHWSERDIDVRADLDVITAEVASLQRAERATERILLVAALSDQGLLGSDFPTQASLDPAHMRELIAAVHVFLARTPSAMLLLNIEDLAASSEQVNLPGPLVGYPCWRLRLALTTRQIFDADWVRRTLASVGHERPAPDRAASGLSSGGPRITRSDCLGPR